MEGPIERAIAEAVKDAVAAEAGPVARQLAEVRGLMNQVLRRLERLEGDVGAERSARVDDLGVLVDLISASWKSVDEKLQPGSGAVVYRIEERRATS